MSRRVKRFLLAVVVCTIWIASVSGLSLAANSSVELLGFVITFEGVVYNPTTNESTWTYRIQGNYTGPHDLSHWIIQLCNPTSTHVVPKQGGSYKASHEAEVSNQPDPHHGIRGIKFNIGVNKNGGDTIFWFVLQGNWEIGEVDIAVKAGLPTASGRIQGPSCTPPRCEIHYSVIRERSDLRVLQPGTYASVLSKLHVYGTGAVRLGFEDFGNAQYIADPSAPPVQLQFSIGKTLSEADAHGWLPADQFNGTELYIDSADVQVGVELTIWVRSIVGTHNSSSDYRGSGKVSIIPDCS